jgi:hypothetical protein
MHESSGAGEQHPIEFFTALHKQLERPSNLRDFLLWYERPRLHGSAVGLVVASLSLGIRPLHYRIEVPEFHDIAPIERHFRCPTLGHLQGQYRRSASTP